jgi:DNA invertase Pin-like site-specific DNA recombinase
MRAAVYCRLSFNPDGASLGLEAQEADGRAYADALGADHITVLADNDISAADPDKTRPAFEQLMEGILVGDYDIVVGYEQSRLTRNAVDHRRLVAACVANGVELHTVKAGRIDIDSPDGKAFSRVVNVFDELYVDKITALTRRNMAERAARGLPLSGRAGFGYRKAAGEDNYVIVEEEAAEIKDAAARVLAGESLASIAADWKRRGVQNRSGSPWRASGVRRILLAARTAGLRSHQGRIVGPAAWPAILDEVTFERVRRVLSDPRRRTANDRNAKLLTGLAECGGCGNTMNHKLTHGRGVYYCRHCHSRSVGADDLDAFVAELAFARIDTTTLRPAAPNDDTADTLAALEDVRERLVALAASWAAGDVGTAEWEAARAVLSGRERDLKRRLAVEPAEPLLAAWQGRSDALAAAWPSIPLGERRRLLRAVFRWVRVGPAVQGLGRFDADRVTFEYAF